MRSELRYLVIEYQAKVAKACDLLRDQLDLPNFEWFSWKHYRVPLSGWLDDVQTIKYRFHGIGCSVTFGSIVVDFDFGPNGRYDGFDAWRLSLFAKSVPNHLQFRDDAPLHEELLDLLNTGELVRHGISLGSHLFYVPDKPLTDKNLSNF